MPSKDLHDKPFSEETITKLEIFEKYLEAWLPVFIKSKHYNEALICDFFAGTGKDINNCDGSPLRIINTIDSYKDYIIKERFKITVVLNEYDVDKYKNLLACVNTKLKITKLNQLIDIQIYNEDFQKLYNDKYFSFQNNTPKLIFIDQNGIRHVNTEIFATLIDLKTTDFLFFISSSYFKRFANEESFKKYHPNLNIDKNTKTSDIHRIVLNYYKSKIPNDNKTRLYPFTIKKTPNIYGLIFGSKHPLGVDKFLKIAWNKNKLNGEANFDIDEDNEQSEYLPLFRNKTKLEKFNDDLIKFIKDKNIISNKDIYDFTIEMGHIDKHALAVMKNLKDQHIIDFIRSPQVNYNNCYNKKDIIEFKVNHDEIKNKN